jgi:pyrroloquinoline-quinone synthase
MENTAVFVDDHVYQAVVKHPIFSSLSSCFSHLYDHEFLVRCRSGLLTHAQLRRFMIQHQHYSKHFLRYLFLLMSRLNHVEDTKHLLHNVLEEMGMEDEHTVPHTILQNEMLRELGVMQVSELPLPETKCLIDRMTQYCEDQNPLIGLSALCLGAEAIVPIVYSAVYHAACFLGYTDQQLKYLQLHVECDDGHALTMYQIILRRIGSSPEMARHVVAVAQQMMRLRQDFLTAVL